MEILQTQERLEIIKLNRKLAAANHDFNELEDILKKNTTKT